MDKIKLVNGFSINIEDGATENNFTIKLDNTSEIGAILMEMVESNLAEVQFVHGEEICGEYTNKRFVNATTEERDGVFYLTIHLASITPMEMRIKALEEGQEVQDEAIVELATIVAE